MMKVTLILWLIGTSGRSSLLIHSLSSPEKVIVNIHVINKPDSEAELKIFSSFMKTALKVTKQFYQYCCVVIHVIEKEMSRFLD